MLKRVSVLFSVFLTACVPSWPYLTYAPPNASSCQNTPPSAAESAAWRRAQRMNTRQAYQAFLARYPRSCYGSSAVARMKTTVQRQPVTTRKLTTEPRRDFWGRRVYQWRGLRDCWRAMINYIWKFRNTFNLVEEQAAVAPVPSKYRAVAVHSVPQHGAWICEAQRLIKSSG